MGNRGKGINEIINVARQNINLQTYDRSTLNLKTLIISLLATELDIQSVNAMTQL